MDDTQEKMEEQGTEEGQVVEQETPAQAGNASTERARIAELEAQHARAKQEAAENWNKYLRERADMDNFRKRQERLANERLQRDKKELFHKVLAVLDNAERALVYQETMDVKGLQQALRMLAWQLSEVLRIEGLTPITTVGEVFNPYVHEAVESVEDSDQPEGTVVEEVQKGYKYGEETLRPARVKVSAGKKQTEV